MNTGGTARCARAAVPPDMGTSASQFDPAASPQVLRRAAPPWWRRLPIVNSLQVKLVLGFTAVLTLVIAGSYCVFVNETEDRLLDMMGEQAKEMATALAWLSEDAIGRADPAELEKSASNLISSRNLVHVGFYDPEGRALVQSSRDPDYEYRVIGPSEFRQMTSSLMRVSRKRSALFGDFFEVTAPVMSTSSRTRGSSPDHASTRLVGYVTVGVSGQYEVAQMHRVNAMVLGVGCIVAMLALPTSYLVVRRICAPIQELVTASRRIIDGNLDARVTTADRSDLIGELARSFNEMTLWVKHNQREIASANAKLEEANRDLEQKVEQRTAALESANRRLSQEIAEKEDFLRAVSHDLNAPLRNISGMATMLLMKNRDKFDEDVVHRLERIKSNVDVETDLISELLELSRIKTRRQKMERVDVEQIVWELRGMFENDLKSKGIDLVLDSTLPQLNCERARVRQVFQNLIDNAIKYMGDKFERRIHVGCQVRATEAEFYVRDTGLGIEAEDVDKVFFVFRRGKNTAAQNIAGKGVGLASVKSIIETYGGRIWVQSKAGEGSTFRFTIDAAYVPATGRAAPLPAESSDPQSTASAASAA
jgi:signal transduction histidine kinase